MSIYCSISAYPWFEDYILSINTVLNFKIKLYNLEKFNFYDDIVIFIQSFPISQINFSNSNKKSKIYLVNMEQLTRTEMINNFTSNFNHFSKICKDNNFENEPIFGDYSLENLELLKKYTFKKIYLPYLVNDKEIEKLKKYINVEKEYDIGFTGAFSNKRNKIINELNNKYKFTICTGWKDERDIQIGKCKILINIHYNEQYNIFETIRCDRWIFSGMKVFSETSIYKNYYGSNFKEVNYENLIADIDNFINQNYNIDNNYYQNEIEFRKNMIKNILN